jgi:MoaA/NifB/PqqE/SkfB family radical SAM enzyme
MLILQQAPSTGAVDPWQSCRFLTCSVLPVRFACNLTCPFCFSKSSISSLAADRVQWSELSVEDYYAFARERGATRLVVTGGGEPLLRADDVVELIARGRDYFSEIACFTNGTFLTIATARRLKEAGLSYLCYSRHHENDEECRRLMGAKAPTLDAFFAAAAGLKIRATCVMAKGFVDRAESVERYIAALARFGVTEFTFKHTYVAYEQSVFAAAAENRWAREHQVQLDPFANQGEPVARLPWGPVIRKIGPYQVCFYFEPHPSWEKEHRLCRSVNLLSDGSVYASLEDHQSLLYRLNSW